MKIHQGVKELGPKVVNVLKSRRRASFCELVSDLLDGASLASRFIDDAPELVEANIRAFIEIENAVPPSQDEFYAVPAGLDDVPPGTILRRRKTPSRLVVFGEPADRFVKESYQILYRTTDTFGNATATVLSVLIPPNADYSKVVSFQVAEDAVTIDCAPSFGFQNASTNYPKINSNIMQFQLLFAEAALHRGWVVVVPDYEGPGGVYPAERFAAYAVLDGLRAAMHSSSITGISRDAKVAVWGYSGGGAASLKATQLQPTYAPELKIAGIAVGGVRLDTSTDFDPLLLFNQTPFASFLPVALLGAARTFPRLEQAIYDNLKPEYREHFYLVRHQCIEANEDTFANEDIVSMFQAHDFLTGLMDQIKDQMVPQTAPQVPVFWYQCINDQFIDYNVTVQTIGQFCSQGSNIKYGVQTANYVDHLTCGLLSAPDAIRWLEGILGGEGPAPGCTQETLYTQKEDPDFYNLFSKFIQRSIDLAYKSRQPGGVDPNLIPEEYRHGTIT
ncbi:hypothetical protein HIM_02395 [Hirsutella minnesotensis 3608]|nr:hypothetical protein HIM_02395 [Hirsutella minnesotensis 3608]